MSTVKPSRLVPVDPAAVAAEVQRVAELNGNHAYQRGIAHAQAQERSNAQHALSTALADLKRVSLKRDTTVAARDAYNRCYARVQKAAERVALGLVGSIGQDGKVITEPQVTIPAWLPPPSPTAAQTVSIGAPRSDASYRESRGLSPDGTGLPVKGPGSQIDPDWSTT